MFEKHLLLAPGSEDSAPIHSGAPVPIRDETHHIIVPQRAGRSPHTHLVSFSLRS